MKRVFIITLLTMLAATSYAQNAKIVGVICPDCGVYFKGDEAKHFDDISYHKSGCTFVKKKLKDVEPMSEITSKYSQADQKRLYGYGHGSKCPHCLGTTHHDSDCPIGYSQRKAKELMQAAQQATTESARKQALWKYQTMEDNINTLAQSATVSTPSQQSASSTSTTAPTQTHVVLPGAYIIKNHDKELSYGDGYARALGATMPNGEERWLLANSKGEGVGEFTKVEFADASFLSQYVLVRNDNGQWGIYDCHGNLMCKPQYESVKTLTPLVGDVKVAKFDVTRRDERGVLKHGIFNPELIEGATPPKNAEIIPCEYDQIELIDRSPAPYGVLAKVRKNGLSGVIDTFNGEEVIPVSYSYINTYFTIKGGMYIIVGDSNGLGAYHIETMEEVVPVTNGNTLDKVRNLINQRDR